MNQRIERQAVEVAVFQGSNGRKARRHCTIQPLHARQNGGLLPASPVHADGCSGGIVRSQERLFLSSVTLRSLRGHYHPPTEHLSKIAYTRWMKRSHACIYDAIYEAAHTIKREIALLCLTHDRSAKSSIGLLSIALDYGSALP